MVSIPANDSPCDVTTDIPMSSLPLGGTGLVTEVACGGPLGERLRVLGLIPGTRVQKLRRGPLGDPCAYSFRDTTIALRRADAATVSVNLIEEHAAANCGTEGGC